MQRKHKAICKFNFLEIPSADSVTSLISTLYPSVFSFNKGTFLCNYSPLSFFREAFKKNTLSETLLSIILHVTLLSFLALIVNLRLAKVFLFPSLPLLCWFQRNMPISRLDDGYLDVRK